MNESSLERRRIGALLSKDICRNLHVLPFEKKLRDCDREGLKIRPCFTKYKSSRIFEREKKKLKLSYVNSLMHQHRHRSFDFKVMVKLSGLLSNVLYVYIVSI